MMHVHECGWQCKAVGFLCEGLEPRQQQYLVHQAFAMFLNQEPVRQVDLEDRLATIATDGAYRSVTYEGREFFGIQYRVLLPEGEMLFLLEPRLESNTGAFDVHH